MGQLPDAMGPCGVFCGACPSFGRSCLGCGSEDRGPAQKRRSKWSCRLRVCCIEERGHDLCIECADFPCPAYVAKLPGSHPGEPRYEYRREAPGNLVRVRDMGGGPWVEAQGRRWTCPDCGGRVVFYHYRCTRCGRESRPEGPGED